MSSFEQAVVKSLRESRQQRAAEEEAKLNEGKGKSGGSGPQHECPHCGYTSDVADFSKEKDGKVKCDECGKTFKPLDESVQNEEDEALNEGDKKVCEGCGSEDCDGDCEELEETGPQGGGNWKKGKGKGKAASKSSSSSSSTAPKGGGNWKKGKGKGKKLSESDLSQLSEAELVDHLGEALDEGDIEHSRAIFKALTESE